MLNEQLAERRAIYEFECDVRHTVAGPKAQDLDDMRRGDPSRDLQLVLEPNSVGIVLHIEVSQELEGNYLAGLLVTSTPDHAHAAPADFVLEGESHVDPPLRTG